MPYYSFREVWTPLRLFNIRFFVDNNDHSFWIKMGKNPRKKLTR